MYLQTSFEIDSVDDLEGKKFQVANPVAAMTIEALGGVPVANIPVTGVSEALSRGVVDGTIGDWLGSFTFRVIDATNVHVDQMPLSMATAFVPINKDTWDKIPEEGKAAIRKYSGETFARIAGGMLDGGNMHFRGKLAEMPGHDIVVLSEEADEAFRARASEAIEAWKKTNPNGEQLHEELVNYLSSIR